MGGGELKDRSISADLFRPDTKPAPASANAGHRQRLKSRFASGGPEALPDYELLEMILFAAITRRDTKPLAKRLLDQFGSFSEVINAPRERLLEVEGIGEAVVAQLKIVRAAAQRMMRIEMASKPVLSSSKAVLDYCRAVMAFETREQPHPVPRQEEPADRRRGAAAGHGGPYARLRARDREAVAGAVGLRHHPRAQPPIGRPGTLAGRHRHDEPDPPGGTPLRHRCPRSSGDRPAGARQLQDPQAALTVDDRPRLAP
jgi:DNA repair protein RadC